MKTLLLYCITLVCFTLPAAAQQQPLQLWYDKPAQTWEEYVPLGNGRLGAMPDGGIIKENIVLNDITLWSGAVQDADKKDAHQYLSQIRQLIFEGKNKEAELIMSKHFVCQGPGSGYGNGTKNQYGSYEILGNLFLNYYYGIDSNSVKPLNYKRSLSLDNALATTQFSVGKTIYTRECFTSFDDDVIVIKLSASQLKKINFTLALNRPERFTTQTTGNELQMTGQLNNGTDGKGMQYIVKVKIKTDGSLMALDSTLKVKDANSATIYISATTDARHPAYIKLCNDILSAAVKKEYSLQKAGHIRNFQKLFNRAKLNLGKTGKEWLPTDKRLEAFESDKTDNGLPVLYFQYGRYLLICSTRPGLLPPNLQGLWANTVQTPWNGDYHLNINLQMNHWPVNVTNLASLNEPFFSYINMLVKPGEKTAKAYYNGEGWVAHVVSNPWGFTSPGEDYAWGASNSGSGWSCQMLWNHYEYTRDTNYLRLLYPVIKGSAAFYLSTLVKEPSHGWLVTVPSSSPENGFIMPDGKQSFVCAGPAIDNQIIRKLFSMVIEASDKLHVDAAFKQSLQQAMPQLPPDQIGKDGRLMEWLEEYKEAEPNHRHVSHLWGLYPGNEITMQGTPALAEAARASLKARGDDGTGWSLAWKMNFWARLQDGNRAFALLVKLLKPVKGSGWSTQGGGAYKNLFSSCPPLQIDGNFGGTAGIAEMLLQSHEGYIEFLPALPDEWNTGEFTGLCVRGGAQVSAKWANKKLKSVTLTSAGNNEFRIKMPDTVSMIKVKKNGTLKPVAVVDHFINLIVKKGESVEIYFF